MQREGIIEKNLTHGILDPMYPRLLTLREAARRLGLTVWGMRERVWAGHIPIVKFPDGRKIYIDAQDLETFIKANKSRVQ